jgi:cobalamin biosynthesis protein CobT
MNTQPNNSGQDEAPEQQQTNQQTEELTTKQIPQTMRDHQEPMIKGIEQSITTELKIPGRTSDDNQVYLNTVNREYNSSPQAQETDNKTDEYQATENQVTTQ